jgi:hypothetical protein
MKPHETPGRIVLAGALKTDESTSEAEIAVVSFRQLEEKPDHPPA